jgi:hypothetical protein
VRCGAVPWIGVELGSIFLHNTSSFRACYEVPGRRPFDICTYYDQGKDAECSKIVLFSIKDEMIERGNPAN